MASLRAISFAVPELGCQPRALHLSVLGPLLWEVQSPAEEDSQVQSGMGDGAP